MSRQRKAQPARCYVCGSSAPIIRAHKDHGTMELCYHHECVCWPHKVDPCPTCESE